MILIKEWPVPDDVDQTVSQISVVTAKAIMRRLSSEHLELEKLWGMESSRCISWLIRYGTLSYDKRSQITCFEFESPKKGTAQVIAKTFVDVYGGWKHEGVLTSLANTDIALLDERAELDIHLQELESSAATLRRTAFSRNPDAMQDALHELEFESALKDEHGSKASDLMLASGDVEYRLLGEQRTRATERMERIEKELRHLLPLDRSNMEVARPPSPSRQSWPQQGRAVALGMCSGLLAGMLLALLRYQIWGTLNAFKAN